METHLEAARALQHQLQQATLEGSDAPSLSQWQSLFDAHILNLENQSIILDKFLTLPGTADIVREELMGLQEVSARSRRATIGLKGLLVLHTKGLLGLAELMTSIKLVQEAAAPHAPGINAAQPSTGKAPPSTAPFDTYLLVSGFANMNKDDLLAEFRQYKATYSDVLSTGHKGDTGEAVLIVPSGRMADMAIRDMDQKAIYGEKISVRLWAEVKIDRSTAGGDAANNASRVQPSNVPAPETIDPDSYASSANGHQSLSKKRKVGEAESCNGPDAEQFVKRVAQPKRTDAPSRHPTPPSPETLDITDEVERRIQEREEARAREREQRMNPSGRKRLRESFESAEHVQLSADVPVAKRHKDNVSFPLQNHVNGHGAGIGDDDGAEIT